jgi:hypothetical protein
MEVLERADSLLTPPAPVYAARTPFDANRVGAAAVYCSDGRFGEQMDEFLHEGLVLPRYDRVAVPGGAACLAGRTTSPFWQKTALEEQLSFLIREHNLRQVILIAHDGCAFYKDLWPADPRAVERQQAQDLATAAACIRFWNPGIEIESYFARKSKGKIVFDRWND